MVFLGRGFMVPTLLQSLLEIIILEIMTMVYDTMGKGHYLPLI
jgi:hypothetical protein